MRKSLFGGYPYEGIKSLEVFPNRVETKIIDGKVLAKPLDLAIWPSASKVVDDESCKDFLLDRIHDYNNALAIAEKQISDMDQEYPFIPEDFNFTPGEVVDDGLGTPMRFYEKGEWILTRAKEQWLLRNSDTLETARVLLPNNQIAFITLRALGVITDEEFEGPVEYVVRQSEITKEEMEAELAKRAAIVTEDTENLGEEKQ